MDGVSVSFAEAVPDCLQDANHIADASVCVFHSHIDDASVIRNTVKLRMHLQPPFAKLCTEIEGKGDVRAAALRINMDHGIKFVLFHRISLCLSGISALGACFDESGYHQTVHHAMMRQAGCHLIDHYDLIHGKGINRQLHSMPLSFNDYSSLAQQAGCGSDYPPDERRDVPSMGHLLYGQGGGTSDHAVA